MHKLLDLIIALKKLSIDDKHLNSVYHLYKEAAISSQKDSERSEKSKSLLYGNNPPENVVVRQKEEPKTEPKTEPKGFPKKESPQSSPQTVNQNYSARINCANGELDLAKKINLNTQTFYSGFSCEEKICVLRWMINFTGHKDQLSFLNLIDGCVRYYKPDFSDQDFVDFLNKYILNETDLKEYSMQILDHYKITDQEIIADLGELTGFGNWLKETKQLENSHLFIPENAEDFKKNSYIYKYIFFDFCYRKLEAMINGFFNEKLAFVSSPIEEMRDYKVYADAFIKMYNKDNSLFKECFKFSKIELDFKNYKPSEENAREMKFQSNKDLEKNIDKTYKEEFKPNNTSELAENMKKYQKDADEEFSALYSHMEMAESGNITAIECAKINKSKAERDQSIMSSLYFDIGQRFNKDIKYYISKEACLNGLLHLAEANLIPMEYVELLYMQNGYKVSLSSLKDRVEDKKSIDAINNIIAFFEKYSNDGSGSNPFDIYKDKTRNKGYDNFYSLSEEQEKEKGDKTSSEFMKGEYDKILNIHSGINKSINNYNQKKQASSQSAASLFEFYKNLFENMEKNFIESDLEEFGYKNVNVAISDLLSRAESSKSIIDNLLKNKRSNGEDNNTDFNTAKIGGEEKVVKYIQKGNEKNIEYITTLREKTLLTKDESGRDCIIIGNSYFYKAKRYPNAASGYLDKYIEDLKSLENSLKQIDWNQNKCGFNSNSKIFQSICVKANSGTPEQIEENLKIALQNLFFDYCIGLVKNNFNNTVSQNANLKSQMVSTLKRLSPSEDAANRLNENNQKIFKDYINDSLKNIQPLSYKQYKIDPKTNKPFTEHFDYISLRDQGTISNLQAVTDAEFYCEKTNELNKLGPAWYIEWDKVGTSSVKSAKGIDEKNENFVNSAMNQYQEAMINFLIQEREKISM